MRDDKTGEAVTVTAACAYCGTRSSVPLETPPDGEALYCPMCGAPLPYPKPKYEECKWPCPYCGFENTLVATKCGNPNCGRPLPRLPQAVEIREREIPCGVHVGEFAVARCDLCGRYLCPECVKFAGKKHYCQPCLDKIGALEEKRDKKVSRIIQSQGLACTFVAISFFVIASIILSISDRSGKFEQYDMAVLCYESGFYDDALEKFSALGDFNGADEMVKKVKRTAFEEELAACETAAAAGDVARAEGSYGRALKYAGSAEERASANLPLARAHYRRGDYESAFTYYEKADGLVELRGADAAAFREAAFFTYLGSGDAAYEEAKGRFGKLDYAEALKHDEEYVRYYDCCRRANAAVKYYERAETLKPAYPGLAGKLAAARKNYDRIKEATTKMEEGRESSTVVILSAPTFDGY
jgi:tetratricopeptide (TPR) repeat protein